MSYGSTALGSSPYGGLIVVISGLETLVQFTLNIDQGRSFTSYIDQGKALTLNIDQAKSFDLEL